MCLGPIVSSLVVWGVPAWGGLAPSYVLEEQLQLTYPFGQVNHFELRGFRHSFDNLPPVDGFEAEGRVDFSPDRGRPRGAYGRRQVLELEIVGIFAGKISRVTEGADHLLVVTRAPVVLGNAPQQQFEHLWETVAFLGQVPVLVVGEVNPGDYILPSGLEDGTGVAISPADLQFEDLPQIVGTAWSVSVNGYVNTALGFKAINWGQVIEDTTKPLIDLRERVRQLELAVARLTRPSGPAPTQR